MFFITNKKHAAAFITCAACAAFGLLCVCGRLNTDTRYAEKAAAVPISGKVIVIDPGHGGFDAGASANGLEEKNINLDVAMYLKEYVEQGGGIAIMTRLDDVSTADADAEGKNAKKSDLTNRKRLAETAEADAFISIHMNKFPQEQYKGAQVFYGSEPPEGKLLGDEIQSAFKEILNDGNQREAKKADKGIFILKDNLVPSVIAECGFLSNTAEARLLDDKEYQKKLAWSVYVGTVRFFNKLKVES